MCAWNDFFSWFCVTEHTFHRVRCWAESENGRFPEWIQLLNGSLSFILLRLFVQCQFFFSTNNFSVKRGFVWQNPVSRCSSSRFLRIFGLIFICLFRLLLLGLSYIFPPFPPAPLFPLCRSNPLNRHKCRFIYTLCITWSQIDRQNENCFSQNEQGG